MLSWAAAGCASDRTYALFAHDSANNYAPAVAVTYSTTRSTPHTTAPGPVKP